MKDLKHLHFFEKLVDSNVNELVEQALANGDKAIGYTCYFAPEVLLNLDGAFALRMRAPNSGTPQIGTYYLSNFTCTVTRSLLERGVENGFNHLSGICASETCAQMNRCLELFEINNLIKTENFFLKFFDVPHAISEHAFEYITNQYKGRLLDVMHENHGINISNEKIIEAVELQNKLNAIMREISDFRKDPENVKITGTEMHLLNLAIKSSPIKLILPYIEETLEEIKKRKPDPSSKYRARVVLVGSEIIDHRLTELIEDAGALVVADRYCFGTFPGYEHIELDHNDPIRSLAEYYLKTNLCPRYTQDIKVAQRRDFNAQLAKDFHADGILVETMKFCDYWGYEKAPLNDELTNDYKIPSVNIETNYTVQASGQIRTRVQAFVENLEIKRISKAKGE